MKKLFWILSISFLAFLQTSCETKVVPKESDSTPISKNEDWKKLTLREKIGQTMMVRSDHANREIENSSLEAFFEKYPVGGIFMAEWHINGQKAGLPFVEYLTKVMREYNTTAPFPLFFSEDFEKGVGNQNNYEDPNCSKMPVLMTLGAANKPDLAYTYGKIVSQESRALGFNWLLHPVADLNMNSLHPLVIERAITDKAEIVIPILQAYTRAMKEHGIISTIKHFPGDGATIRDQHLITSANNLSMTEWKKTFGKVFETMIQEDIPSIMVGHLQFPAYQKDSIDGVLPPATLSKDIMTKLLKNEMGYRGVIMSDAMNMGGPMGFYEDVLEASVQFFIAGGDMILWPDLAYMDTVEARIIRGEIPMSRLDDAVERVWAVREKYDMLTKKSDIVSPLPADHAGYVKESLTTLAESAVTVIQDKNNDIPLNTGKIKKIMLVDISFTDNNLFLKNNLSRIRGTITPKDSAAIKKDIEELNKKFKVIKEELESRGFQVDIMNDFHFWDWEWRIKELASQYDKFIACFDNSFMNPVGSPLLKGQEAFHLWSVKFLPKDKVISVSFSNPYYNTFYLETTPLLINAYSFDEYMQRAVVKVLTGEVKATAKSPVDLYNPIMK